MINLTNPLWGKLNTLSASRISSFFSCGVRFRNEYIYEMKPPGGIPAFRGDAIHHAVAEDNKLFIGTKRRMPIDSLIEIAIEKFDTGITKDGVFLCKSKENELDTLLEKARSEIKLCMNMYADYKKDWSPVSIEERVNIDVGYPLNMVAYMDMTDEDCCIWDWKTTAKTPAIYEGLQNWVYSKIFEKQFGIKPTFKYFCFVLTKKTPRIEIQQLAQVRDYTILDKYVETYLDAIEKEVFLPSTQWNFLCSEVCCPFYRCCEFKKNERNKDGK